MYVISQVRPCRLSGYKAVLASLTGAALTAACAQIAFYLPGKPVPITMQVFAVLCCSFLLGGRYAAVAQIEFLTAGLLGAPVFAGFRAGPAALAGPTGGYLVGFVAAAFVAGLFFETARHKTFTTACVAGLLGVAVIYVFGVSYLALWQGSRLPGLAAWLTGVVPFVGVDAAKVALAAAVCVGRRYD